MYLSASYLPVKLNQDRAYFSALDNERFLCLCDGIGEFEDSGKVAEEVISAIKSKGHRILSAPIDNNFLNECKPLNIVGGTTVILCCQSKFGVRVQHLGNGGAIHLCGDFHERCVLGVPYQFIHLLLPHVNEHGALTRHVSHDSGDTELVPSLLEIATESNKGDIFLFFTDGINSLESNLIIKDDIGRYWRNESDALQFILDGLHAFLQENVFADEFQDKLVEFNKSILDQLKEKVTLEDDASLGIVITEKVLDHYRIKQGYDR